MAVRAKFFVSEVKHLHGTGTEVAVEVKLAPVFGGYPGGPGDENKSFSKYTPQGEIRMLITNPSAIEQFELGKPYYVDFTPA